MILKNIYKKIFLRKMIFENGFEKIISKNNFSKVIFLKMIS
jgi:hypothetical protein